VYRPVDVQYARVVCSLSHDWRFLKVILSIMYLLNAINVLCVCRGHERWCSCDILHICHNSAYGVWCCERQAELPDAIFLSPSLRLLYC